MVALLKTKIPRESREARIELEKIVRESPKHLNALADLETIYRNLHRIHDADRCRRTINNILKSTSDADVQIKKTCLLEQGYAILIERTIVNENTLELRISDIHKILTVEYDKSDGERRECLGRIRVIDQNFSRAFIVTALISSSKPPSLYGERRSKES
jgi:hypothetical protein